MAGSDNVARDIMSNSPDATGGATMDQKKHQEPQATSMTLSQVEAMGGEVVK
jgi:hypothetical protein